MSVRPAVREVAKLHPAARLPDEWRSALEQMGERPFRAQQVFQWIHRKGVLAPQEMSDLPATLRDKLATEGLRPVGTVRDIVHSQDGTRKLLVAFEDGCTVETVLIPNHSDQVQSNAEPMDADLSAGADDEEDEPAGDNVVRITQCISTQVGCAMGCSFCASGVAGLKRHLTPEEIVAQVLIGRSVLTEREVLRNVVFMGMGEPLHNYDATTRALRLLTRSEGINLSTRRVTVSTCGIVPGIDKLGEEFGGQVTIAISLHATTDDRRTQLMPINRKYPLSELLAALRRHPLPRRRRFTIEFTLIEGVNDSLAEARRLAALLRGIPVKINLIPMNPIRASEHTPSDTLAVLAFQKVLINEGYSCFIRRRRGDDVSAACGQLALLGAKPRIRRPAVVC